MMNTGLRVDRQRLSAAVEIMGGFSETSTVSGYSRPTFSSAWARALEYAEQKAQQAGGKVVKDAFGNTRIFRPHTKQAGPLWLCGSHLDSVPSGGKYDGVIGVAVALEVFIAAPEAPLEIIIFAEEEGTAFGLGMLGSRSWAGEVTPAALGALKNRAGVSYLEAGAEFGVNPEYMDQGKLIPEDYQGMIEVHAEQGPGLWNKNLQIAAVTAINGRREYEVRLKKQTNHAGTTGMNNRRDALAGAAEAVLAVETLGRQLDMKKSLSVMTAGRMAIQPNAMNVIPGYAAFSVDFRAQDEELLDEGEKLLRRRVKETAEKRGLTGEVVKVEQVPPTPLSSRVRKRFQSAAGRLGIELPEVPSGALHDAAKIAPHLPTGMLFVPSRDGLSHHPGEFSRMEDIALAAQIVLETLS